MVQHFKLIGDARHLTSHTRGGELCVLQKLEFEKHLGLKIEFEKNLEEFEKGVVENKTVEGKIQKYKEFKVR